MIQLSKNFTDAEFVFSGDYPAIARKIVQTDYHRDIARLMCQSILQPLRDVVGTLHLLSGLRSEELNKIVGGQPNSEHLYGCAVDIVADDYPSSSLFGLICKMEAPYRKLILYPGKKIIHVSINIPGLSYAHAKYCCEKDGVYTPII